ncbi:MAG: hypothetical protein ABSC20_08175 [Candidatus Bathyarchaeia archaeon]|jgi:hypothetical protein
MGKALIHGLEVACKVHSGFENQHKNEIIEKIVEVIGLERSTVIGYLHDEFKQVPHGGSDKSTLSASERVENALGKDVVDKIREEIKAEETLWPLHKKKKLKRKEV